VIWHSEDRSNAPAIELLYSSTGFSHSLSLLRWLITQDRVVFDLRLTPTTTNCTMQSSQLVNLPLAKYSRAVDVPKDVANFTWTHFTQGLILVLDNFRGDNNGYNTPSLMLKVVNETQVLVSVRTWR
jgi:hypothetical protein